jgi:hypothetical protein
MRALTAWTTLGIPCFTHIYVVIPLSNKKYLKLFIRSKSVLNKLFVLFIIIIVYCDSLYVNITKFAYMNL